MLTKAIFYLSSKDTKAKPPDYSVTFEKDDPVFPCYILTVGDCKGGTGNFKKSDKTQVIGYAQRVLYAQQCRRSMVVFLVNAKLVRFGLCSGIFVCHCILESNLRMLPHEISGI